MCASDSSIQQAIKFVKQTEETHEKFKLVFDRLDFLGDACQKRFSNINRTFDLFRKSLDHTRHSQMMMNNGFVHIVKRLRNARIASNVSDALSALCEGAELVGGLGGIASLGHLINGSFKLYQTQSFLNGLQDIQSSIEEIDNQNDKLNAELDTTMAEMLPSISGTSLGKVTLRTVLENAKDTGFDAYVSNQMEQLEKDLKKTASSSHKQQV